MYRLEWKKILNIKKAAVLLFVFLFSSVFFFLQLKGVENGADTGQTRKLYEKIEGKGMEEAGKVLEGEKELVEDTISREDGMEEAYMKGEISADEYLEYRDLYHECMIKQNAVAYVYDRYLQAAEQGGGMVFDLYYCRLFVFRQMSAGLLAVIVFMCIFLVNCEPDTLLPVLYATPEGKAGLKKAKFLAAGSASAVAAVIFTAAEYGIYLWFLPFTQTGMRVQGISTLCGIPFPLTVGAWLVLYVFVRAAAGVLAGTVLFSVFYSVYGRRKEF